MIVTFRAAGSGAGNATVATQAIAQPATTQINDILIAVVINKALTNVMSPPDATWFSIYQADGDCTVVADDHRVAIWWKRATANGAANHTFTKATDDNVLFYGAIIAYSGCISRGSPIDATAVGATVTAAAGSNGNFPAFDPTATENETVFVCVTGNDLTTFAAAMSSDTNPDCTTRLDVETSTGTDCSIGITSGRNDGSNIAARTWGYAPTTTCGNSAIVFALVAESRQFITHH